MPTQGLKSGQGRGLALYLNLEVVDSTEKTNLLFLEGAELILQEDCFRS